MIHFSVLMPTYNQCAFIRRAILSLIKQTYTYWELIIINDGCTDETEIFISDYLKDARISYIKNNQNQGLGNALNQGLKIAKYDHIAYLPSDDFYYENHLETLKNKFEESSDIVLVYSGIKFNMSDSLTYYPVTEAKRIRSGFCLQLVQVAHRKIDKCWLTRDEYITEDLFQMYWYKLLDQGSFSMTNTITCYWTSHRYQRHMIISELFGGGLNIIRSYYKIKKPIKLKVSKVKFINEEILNAKFNNKVTYKKSALKILIVGELAYNPERIYALEQAGHKLYGLWVPSPEYSFSTVGHLPFGNIEDIPNENWEQRVREIKPDIIYGLLNAGAIPFVFDVVKKCTNIPYVWHFKEGPSLCFQRGTWDKLIYLYRHASGCIFLNSIVKNWYLQFLPPSKTPTLIMDGDLPKADYFTNEFTPKLSDIDGEIHTLVAGRMIGITPQGFKILAMNKIHIHLYNENYYEMNTRRAPVYKNIAPDFFHHHPHVSSANWTKEFSKYDAGWLHCHCSNNNNLLIASWDDLNIPARFSTYAAAGLPVIMPENKESVVASKEIADSLNIGIFFNDYNELSEKLKKEVQCRQLSKNMILKRMLFSFDYNLPELIKLFISAIKYYNENRG